MTIPGLVLGLLAFAALDRAGLWANRRFRLPWRRDETGRPVSTIAVGELDTFMHGTHRHRQDERASSLMLRDEENDGAPPRNNEAFAPVVATLRRDDGTGRVEVWVTNGTPAPWSGRLTARLARFVRTWRDDWRDA
ncbi:DUF6191 domain-containing protein [Actinomadura sp. WMMB 499]|uniref:DUF6191 domain-containing protein n=1 Tax=Actinomadura sp. WMMB 499 TaxID=1219491 RepID=UPI00124774AE|nr:DUF6191 domain-containing protein [Actinomadura sp. WMMB 499]QFG20755.1 hypothetical protein F7P10_05920 [Actinomadura sp. WMMB 499]